MHQSKQSKVKLKKTQLLLVKTVNRDYTGKCTYVSRRLSDGLVTTDGRMDG